MQIIIPKRFQLLGVDFTVQKKMTDMMKNDGLMGQSRFSTGEILLHPDMVSDALEHTYFHELVHMILVALNEGELNVNERFVDMFAGLLHQSFKTAKGEIKK